jgi:hypothetical protein
VPGLDSRAVSAEQRGEDLPFDYGARGGSGHLMLMWGGGGRRGSRVSLERGGDPLEGCWTLEVETYSRGAGPSSEAEIWRRST